MTRASDRTTYTIRSLQQMLGLSRGVIAGLVASGFVTPGRGARHEYRFTFQDIVLLRTAVELQAARIAPRRIVASLRKLRAELPAELPLSGLRIRAVGDQVTVSAGGARWQAESGQQVLDFELGQVAGSVSFLKHREPEATPRPAPLTRQGARATAARVDDNASADAAELFARGEALESLDAAAAESFYVQALTLDPDHADSYLNLGALLCEAARCDEAVALFDEALRRFPDEASMFFNRAIALEDQGRHADALTDYGSCLALAPTFADAHFNAARLHEKRGDVRQALRHFSAYRRLQWQA